MAAPQNNDRPVVNALVVTPTTPMPWTVIVQVLQKNTVKLSKDGKKFQGYVLVDMEGTMVGTVSYEQHVSAVNRLLQPYPHYYVSNAFVKDARAEYKLGDYPYAWTLSSRTPIELIQDSVPQNIPCDFHLTKFSELHKWIDHDESIGWGSEAVIPVKHQSNTVKTNQAFEVVVLTMAGHDDLATELQLYFCV